MLYVSESQIKNAGLGLFTLNAIPKGSLVIEYKGTITPENSHDIHTYCYDISPGYCLTGQDIARYVNDAINSQFANNVKWTRSHHKIYLEAICDILPDEELFVSYGLEYWLNDPRMNKVTTRAYLDKLPFSFVL